MKKDYIFLSEMLAFVPIEKYTSDFVEKVITFLHVQSIIETGFQ